MTSPPSSARAGGNVDRIRRIVELILLDDTFEAEAVLRELNAAKRHGLNHRHSRQIQRIEQYFEQVSGRKPWPVDFQPGQLIHFRDVIGLILKTVPLSRLLDDLKTGAMGKNSLLYFLSTEQGKRSSRWEMLALVVKQERHEADKLKYKAEAKLAYERIFGAGGQAKPSWIVKLEDERRQKEFLLQQTHNRDERVELEQRLEFIKKRVLGWEQSQNRRPLTSP